VILVLLQNAWFSRRLDDVGEEWSPRWVEVWKFATHQSRTGQRLRLMFGDDVLHREDVVVDEANRKVAYGSSRGKFPADLGHLKRTLRAVKPDVVLAMGQEAAKVSRVWPGPLVITPHPAHRLATNRLFLLAAAKCLDAAFKDRVLFRMSERPGQDGVFDVIVKPVNGDAAFYERT
jgi:hypothetical protein